MKEFSTKERHGDRVAYPRLGSEELADFRDKFGYEHEFQKPFCDTIRLSL